VTTDACPERHIPFENIHNFRDLGGYPTEGGGRTRYGVVYRSATVHLLSEADRLRLRELAVGHVIDLRSFRELDRDGFADLSDVGIERRHVPVFPDIDVSPEQMIARYRLYTQDYALAYRKMLAEAGETFRTVFETVAGAERPVVVHCVGGKDRAGMASALLLLGAGVGEETVIEDYILTAELLPPPAPERIQIFIDQFGLTKEDYLAMWQAERGSMERTLAVLRDEFGGAETYLASIGVTDELRGRVLERFVENQGRR
jgi:protein-tyrosine phosphatase